MTLLGYHRIDIAQSNVHLFSTLGPKKVGYCCKSIFYVFSFKSKNHIVRFSELNIEFLVLESVRLELVLCYSL
ncbi:MAG: hypothetical protein Sapg2KO_24530 [Saprospiraceae bacterium]